MTRVLGAVALLVAALVYIRARASYHQRSLECYEGLLLHLSGLRRYISGSLGTIGEYLELRVEGGDRLARAITDGDRAGQERFLSGLFLSDKARTSLLDYFSLCGRGYLSDEIKLLDECISAVGAEYRSEKEDGEKSLKVSSVFAVCLAVGAVILFL